MVGPRTNGLGGKTPVFFKLTENTSDGILWQLFPTGNETYILRTKASRTNAYLAVQSNAESSATPQESEVIMRDVNGASNEVFWKINRFKNGGYNFENVANGTGWHLQAKDFENLTMTNDIAERDIQKFQFTPFTNAGFINDSAFSSLKLPSGSTATVPGLSNPTPSQSGSLQSPSTAISSRTKIAIGVAVGLGILVIVALLLGIVFLLRRRRSKQTMYVKSAKGLSSELHATPQYPATSPVQAGPGMGPQKYTMRELPADLPIQELDSKERRPDQKS